MSSLTPKIFEALCAGFSNPYPPEPRNPDVWKDVPLPRMCFDKMMATTGIETNSRPDLLLFAVAKELYRRGYNPKAIEQEAFRFNDHNLRQPILRSRVRVGILGYERTEFYHCCSHDLLKEFCVGREKCDWFKWVIGQERKQHSDVEKFENMYASILRTDVKRVYSYFLEIENKNRLRPGQTIFRSYRQIALDIDFKDKGIAQRACKKLEEFGLLKIVFQGRSGSEATSLCSGFQRISPVPPPQIPSKEVSDV